MKEKDKRQEYYDIADNFIDLANMMTDEYRVSQISASMMYASARYQTFVSATQMKDKKEFIVQKDEIMEYFIDEYRKAINENFEEYLENFEEYTQK